MSLNKEQIIFIHTEVRKAALTLSELHDEIVDHVCCEVESAMKEGKTFEEAYVKIQTGITIHSIKEIEKDTKMLLNKNFIIMDTTMKISGNISLAAISTGTLMKIFSVAGANTILISGFVLLCLFFIPAFIFLHLPKIKNSRKNLLNLIPGVTGVVALAAGILFKTMNWKLSNILIASGYFLVILSILIILYQLQTKKKENANHNLHSFGLASLMLFIMATAFKMFSLPAAAVLLIIATILLIGVFLPLMTWKEFKATGKINERFIFLIILSIYMVTMGLLISYHPSHTIDIISSN
jgi:hypothetical protein